MTTKHTPGPWRADLEDTNGHFGWSIGSIAVDHIATVYANFINSSRKRGDMAQEPQNQESIANARLIAAAPDLLAACEWIIDACTYEGEMITMCACGKPNGIPAIVAHARAPIKKAKQ